MKRLIAIFFMEIFFSASYPVAGATREFGVRFTHHGGGPGAVPVQRQQLPWYNDPNVQPAPIWVQHADDEEQAILKMYKDTVLITKATDFKYHRNCFDYAWAPWMSCCPNTSLPAFQQEAWCMEPDQLQKNWTDNSMTRYLASAGKTPDDGEYYFRLSDIQLLEQQYRDVLGNMLELPVADGNKDDPFSLPAHSAYLVPYAWFTPVPMSLDFVVLKIRSKWGWMTSVGVVESRWGNNYIDPLYSLLGFRDRWIAGEFCCCLGVVWGSANVAGRDWSAIQRWLHSWELYDNPYPFNWAGHFSQPLIASRYSPKEHRLTEFLALFHRGLPALPFGGAQKERNNSFGYPLCAKPLPVDMRTVAGVDRDTKKD